MGEEEMEKKKKEEYTTVKQVQKIEDTKRRGRDWKMNKKVSYFKETVL